MTVSAGGQSMAGDGGCRMWTNLSDEGERSLLEPELRLARDLIQRGNLAHHLANLGNLKNEEMRDQISERCIEGVTARREDDVPGAAGWSSPGNPR